MHIKKRRKPGPKDLPARWEPRFFEQADSRYQAIKLVRERVQALADDVDADSEQKRLLVSRAAFLSILLETMEVKHTTGEEELDVGKWTQAVNALTGLLAKLGIERKVPAVDLATYLKGKEGRRRGHHPSD